MTFWNTTIRNNNKKNKFLNCFSLSLTHSWIGDVKGGDVDTEWLDMTNGCIKEVRRQIQAEINASVNYLAMAAHFSKDTVNRPGFAKFFFHSASEEREHAMKLIEYLLMRSPLENPDKDSEDSLIQVNVSFYNPFHYQVCMMGGSGRVSFVEWEWI